MNTELRQAIEEITNVADMATGCRGAGDYARWARAQGYTHIEVLNWTSSAGDWQFIVSEDGVEWYVMYQENNWPRADFTRQIDMDQVFYGDAEEVLELIYELYY